MKKILIASGLMVVIVVASYFVYQRYIFKHVIDIETLVSFSVTGEEGTPTIDKHIKEDLNKEVESFMNYITFDTKTMRQAKHNTTIDVAYTYDPKLLDQYRIKLVETNDGILSIPVGPLNYYVRTKDDLTPEVTKQINALLQPKIDQELQVMRDAIACASCGLTIVNEEAPVLIATYEKIVDDIYVDSKLYLYRYHVSGRGQVVYFDQYLATFYGNVHVLADGQVEIKDDTYMAITLDFSLPTHYVSQEDAMAKFYEIFEK